MSRFYAQAIMDFCIAFGVVLGGSLLAGMAAVFLWKVPSDEMLNIAGRIKIWAIVVAVGGTIDPMRVIETNVLEGHLSPAVRQVAYILCAFLGAHTAAELVQWMCRQGE